MTTVELPYEIWLHIFRFLDAETIRQLRFVDTLLYDLSLDEHHSITQIGYPYPGVIDYPPLRDQRDSRRVRQLLIRRGPIYPPKNESPKTLGSTASFWKLIRKSIRMRHIVHHEPKTGLDRLLEAIPALTKLNTLDVCLPFPNSLEDPFHPMKMKVLEVGWPVFSANLTMLSLEVPLEGIHLVVPSHITLLRLESLSIDLYSFYPKAQTNELIRRRLLPLLINLGPTLRSLKLAARENVDMSLILADLQHMPYLRSLDISHIFLSVELTSFVGHQLFLEAHQLQLRHLSFDFLAQPQAFPSDTTDITDEFFNQEWCSVLLPELQSLSFRLFRFVLFCEAAAIPYLQRQISIVKSLRVHSLCFSYDQVVSIIGGPGSGGHQLTALRTLDMEIHRFSPDILSLLADRIPQLQLLKLAVIVIGPDKHQQPEHYEKNRVPEFCEALQSRGLPDWGLHEIDITHRYGRYGPPFPPSLRNQCKVALFRALPNLKLFCGLGPEGNWPEEQEVTCGHHDIS